MLMTPCLAKLVCLLYVFGEDQQPDTPLQALHAIPFSYIFLHPSGRAAPRSTVPNPSLILMTPEADLKSQNTRQLNSRKSQCCFFNAQSVAFSDLTPVPPPFPPNGRLVFFTSLTKQVFSVELVMLYRFQNALLFKVSITPLIDLLQL